jgi:glycine/D-amino acid oxidase-like deaminating enzyme
MSHVVIIGCGVIGAAIAYELSQSGLQVTVLDQHPPAQAATGAALGVLMGVISHKVKGQAWQWRQASLQRYESLIPELEALTGRSIPFNRQGILLLQIEEDHLNDWQSLIDLRHQQGWPLEQWDLEQIQARCSYLQHPRLTGAIYSPCDRQVDPKLLTLALVEAAQLKGASFQFGVRVAPLIADLNAPPLQRCHLLQTSLGQLAVDWVVIAAGLGSTPLMEASNAPIAIHPVLGQAIHIKLAEPLGDRLFQPVITANDIHIVPVKDGEYWVGATVEFPTDGEVVARQELLEQVWQGAIAFCPRLATATILHTWSGLRPRPQQRPAPIVEPLSGFQNVLLATGHYRNGILLAPATAQKIRSLIESNQPD